jgi:hypothetical protein
MRRLADHPLKIHGEDMDLTGTQQRKGRDLITDAIPIQPLAQLTPAAPVYQYQQVQRDLLTRLSSRSRRWWAM